MELEQVPFRLDEMLDNLASTMAANVGNKDLELVISASPQLDGELLGDALRLEQVLVNLTSNAIKFTEHGTVMVEIKLLAQDDKIVRLRFSVRDTGIGIPLEKQAQIFASFTQADISTTRRFGGTGLGLSICRHLVKQMGGEIGVLSEVGQGSEFWFTIPFECCAASKSALPDMTRLEVLVVDDSEIARENLSLMASAIGWDVSKAGSGDAAIEMVRSKLDGRESYDVLLVDWKMPGMDGLAMANTIRHSEMVANSPIILMVTAYSRDELLAQSEIEVVDGILSKPVTSSALYNGVAEALYRRGRASAGGLRTAVRRKERRIPGVHVLVVDDSEINREVAQRILEDDGASVSLANDGQAALAWLAEHTVDVVLMDIQMPVMDGYEATQLLRASAYGANLPVIALTAGAFKAQQDAACAVGMNAFISKPFNVEELMATIQRLTYCQPETPVAENAVVLPDAVEAGFKSLPASLAANLPASLPGIALEKGLSVWRDLAMYRKFLLKFVAEYADCASKLKAYYRASEHAPARALLHKMKGAAGNLALIDIARVAGELELSEPGSERAGALKRLQIVMQISFASITMLTAEPQPTLQALPISASHEEGQVASLLAELLRALDTDNPDSANHLLEKLMPMLAADALTQVGRCVDDFDFRGAEVLVQTLMCQLAEDLCLVLKA